MKIYKVGGYVRDMALGLNPKDCDYVVVGSNEAEMLALNYEKVGADFPVFLHPETRDEYALARIERKTGSGYNGFSVCVDGVTLEQDLFRRDLTINAMAIDDNGFVIDPFGGMDDLVKQTLRHISEHFAEDPVRILRVARFSARYNFDVAPETQKMMKEMVKNGEFDSLTQERVWKEFEKVFLEPHLLNFFNVLKEINALERLIGFNNNTDFNHLLKIKETYSDKPEQYFMSNLLFVFSNIDSNSLLKWKLPSDYVQKINAFNQYKDNTLLYSQLDALEKIKFIMSNRALHSQEQALLILENCLLFQNKQELIDNENKQFLKDVESLKSIDYENIIKSIEKSEIKKTIKEAQINIISKEEKKLKI